MNTSEDARVKVISKFLETLAGKNPVALTAIGPKGPCEATAVTHSSPSAIRDFITKCSDKNIYYTPNGLSESFQGVKASKNDVEWINAVWTDIDPPGDAGEGLKDRGTILSMLQDLSPKPTVVVDSGRGYQALWIFHEAYPACEYFTRAEQLGKAIAEKLGGDPVQSVDHLLRLPGTRNHPTKPKRAKGWSESESLVVNSNGPKYSIEELEKLFDVSQHKPRHVQEAEPVDISFSEIRSRLAVLDPDTDREEWIRIGMAIHHHMNGDAVGMKLWEEFSQLGAKYVDGEPMRVWQSFGKKNLASPVTIRSFIKLTNEAGYEQKNQSQFFDTDFANMHRIVAKHRERIRYCDQIGWMYFNGQHWEPSKHKPMQLAMDTFNDMLSEHNPNVSFDQKWKWARRSQQRASIEAAVTLAKSAEGMQCDISDFDRNPDVLLVRNGLLDLSTGTLSASRFDQWSMNMAGTSFDPEATCPRWLQFLEETFDGSQQLMDYIQRAVGYSLSGHVSEQKFFFLYGTGANGKSVFTETIQALLGDYGATTPTASLMQDRGAISNDIARLRGKRFVTANETNESSRFDEAFIKDLTGGDTISARFLYKEPFQFHPQFKLWIRGNHKPNISGVDEGMWRRLQLVPFRNIVPPEKRDMYLVEHLRKELPGILNWAIKGYQNWREDGLRPPNEVVSEGQRYREEADLLGQFILDRCKEGASFSAKSEELCQEYNHWQSQNGNEKVGSKVFSNQMISKGYRKKRTSNGFAWLGIQVRSDVDGDDDEFDRTPTKF